MTKYVYGIIHTPYAYESFMIPDGADSDAEYAYSWFLEHDEDATHM